MSRNDSRFPLPPSPLPPPFTLFLHTRVAMHQWRTIEVASDATSPPFHSTFASSPREYAATAPRDVARRQPGDGARKQPRLCKECGSTLGAGCVRASRPRIGKTSAKKLDGWMDIFSPLPLGFFLGNNKEQRGV